MDEREKKLNTLQDFMAKISFWILEEIKEKRSYKNDSEVLEFLIDKMKYNISLKNKYDWGCCKDLGWKKIN